MAANSWNLAGTSWGLGNWGEQSDTTVTLTGIELTSSLGEVSAYNESGWGRYFWGDLCGGFLLLSVLLYQKTTALFTSV